MFSSWYLVTSSDICWTWLRYALTISHFFISQIFSLKVSTWSTGGRIQCQVGWLDSDKLMQYYRCCLLLLTANLPPLTFILASWRCFTISCSWHSVLTPTDNPNDGKNYNCLLIKQWFISKWLQDWIKNISAICAHFLDLVVSEPTSNLMAKKSDQFLLVKDNPPWYELIVSLCLVFVTIQSGRISFSSGSEHF